MDAQDEAAGGDLPAASSITALTRFVALVGDPVAHSRSPQLHTAAFRALGLDLVYLACRVTPGGLAAAVAGLHSLGAVGANVTVPHKEAVVPLLGRLTPAARAVGAVNTLVREDGGWLGENTDVAGFLDDLQPHAERLRGAEMVVLGAGGAARAAIYALLTTLAPRRLTLGARSTARAERLAVDMAAFDPGRSLRVVAAEDAGAAIRAAGLVVNATPLGMHPDEGATPWPRAKDFGPGQLVYDLVYTPRQTRLLREAAAQGAETLGGAAMLLGQAAAAFSLWTGRAMPLDVARATLDAELS